VFSAALLGAQTPQVKRGGDVFRATCAVAYCHGPEGSAGRAPRLAGHTFSAAELFDLIVDGKPGTGMPGFARQLKTEEIEAVTQYVMSLSGPSGGASEPVSSSAIKMPAAAEKGRGLFFDSVRMGGCGKCHELADRGSAVGPDLRASPTEAFQNLRTASHNRVLNVKPAGEDSYPAILVEQTPERIRVFDLSSALPVLRTFAPAQVRLTVGSTWSHASAVENYSDAELEAISIYLKWLTQIPRQSKK
jgi:mono/diheme cytochrome c family protein